MKYKAKRALPAGAIIPLPNGKATKARLRKPLSEEATLKIEAEELIVALADAAHDIGVAGVVNDYSKNDFHLYPRHLIALLASDHPLRAWLSEEREGSRARVAVPWPWRR